MKKFIFSGPGVVFRSKAVVLLLMIRCLMLLPLWGFSVCSMFCCAPFLFYNHNDEEERGGCFTMLVILMSYD